MRLGFGEPFPALRGGVQGVTEDESLLGGEESVRMVGGLGSALGDEHGDASCGVGHAADQVELVDPIVLIVLIEPVALAKPAELVKSVKSAWLARLIEGVESAGRARVVEWGERIGVIRSARGVGRGGVRCRGSGLGDTRLVTASRGRFPGQ